LKLGLLWEWHLLGGFFNRLNLVFADADLAAEGVEFYHPAFFTIGLNGNSLPVFQDQRVVR
jgi:hypothetical protein